MQNFVSRKSSKSRKYSKTYWPAELSQPHVICIPKIFEDFFACRILLAANHQNRESTQSLFRMQNCLSRKSSISRKYSKTFRPQNCLSRKSSISRKYSKIFSPAEMSQQQIIGIPKMLKVFFACRIVLAANHQNPEKNQSVFRMQNCLSRKSSISRNYSKTFSPAEISQPQLINIPKRLKVFFECRIVLAANHQYPEKTQRLFARRIVLATNHQYPGNIQRFFRLQKCLSRKSSISRKYSKTFSPAELSQQQILDIPEIFKDFSRLQKCLSRKSSKSRKYSKTYWPAELSQPHVICIPKIFEDFFACRIVLAANHQNRESTQSLFRMQNCLSRKSSISRKDSKTFRPQNCLSHKSSISRKYSKIFSPAEMSQPQVINIPEIFKDFFACRIVLAANP